MAQPQAAQVKGRGHGRALQGGRSECGLALWAEGVPAWLCKGKGAWPGYDPSHGDWILAVRKSSGTATASLFQIFQHMGSPAGQTSRLSGQYLAQRMEVECPS